MAVTGQILPTGEYLQTSDGVGDVIFGDRSPDGVPYWDDVMYARGGNDRLHPGGGNNNVYGGKGDDTLTVLGKLVGLGHTLAYGGKGDDLFSFLNEIIAPKQMHSFFGGDGVDTLSAFIDGAAIQSGPMQVRGMNVSFGSKPALAKLKDIERIEGTPMDDFLRPNADVTTLIGYGGDDRLHASPSATGATLAGNAGQDILVGSDSRDIIYDGDLGLIGLNTIPKSWLDHDVMKGGAGNDDIFSTSGADRIIGGKGDDEIFSIGNGTTSIIKISGAAGDDTVSFHYGHFYTEATNSQAKARMTFDQSQLTSYSVDGGTGQDTLNFSALTNTAVVNGNRTLGITLDMLSNVGTERGTGNNGTFVVRRFEDIVGTARSDIISGDRGKNVLEGNLGEDILRGKGGNDKIFGNGISQLFQTDTSADRLYGGAGKDKVLGEGGNDVIFGGDGSDKLFGGDGRDKIFGGAGKDVIFGGAGSDRLTGGADADRFVFSQSDMTRVRPVITDFNPFEDEKIELELPTSLVPLLSVKQLTSGVLVEWRNWDLLLKDVELTDLTSSTFIF